MEKDVLDILSLLEAGKTIQIMPHGYSMYPMFIPGRDSAIINAAKETKLKRGDVVLYKRDHGILVLHRIWKIDAKGIYMNGDNQLVIEGPLRLDQVKGKLVAFIRNNKTISTQNLIYKIIACIWINTLPVRGIAHATVRKTRAIIGKERVKSNKEQD